MIFLLVGPVGCECRDINSWPAQTSTATEEFFDQKDFEPPLKGTEPEVERHSSSEQEDNLGKRHAMSECSSDRCRHCSRRHITKSLGIDQDSMFPMMPRHGTIASKGA
jgi:hypothetical protein